MKTLPSPTSVTLQNLVALSQTIRAYVDGSIQKIGPSSTAFQSHSGYTDLGVVVDSQLRFADHIATIAQKSHQRAN